MKYLLRVSRNTLSARQRKGLKQMFDQIPDNRGANQIDPFSDP